MSTTSNTLIRHDDPQLTLSPPILTKVSTRGGMVLIKLDQIAVTHLRTAGLPHPFHGNYYHWATTGPLICNLSNCPLSLQQSKFIGMDVPNKKLINLYLFLLKSETLTAKFSPAPSLYGYFTKTSRTNTDSHCTEASN